MAQIRVTKTITTYHLPSGGTTIRVERLKLDETNPIGRLFFGQGRAQRVEIIRRDTDETVEYEADEVYIDPYEGDYMREEGVEEGFHYDPEQGFCHQ